MAVRAAAREAASSLCYSDCLLQRITANCRKGSPRSVPVASLRQMAYWPPATHPASAPPFADR